MVLLKKLELNNFLSHENTIINFTGDEKALVDGLSGAGKSSLFDAIIWCLYGQGRADNKSIIRKRTKSASVTLVLERDAETIIITREITRSGKHDVEVAIQSDTGPIQTLPVSGIRETQAWIEKELIGASYLLFVNSAAYIQGNGDNFVIQSAPKRKELLLEIVKAENYKKYYEDAREKLQEFDHEEALIQGRLTALEGNLNMFVEQKGSKDMYIQELAKAEAELPVIQKKIDALEIKKEEFLRMFSSRMTLLLAQEQIKRQLVDTQAFLKTRQDKASTIKIGLEFKLSDKEVLSEHLNKLLISQKELRKAHEEYMQFYGTKPLATVFDHEIMELQKQIHFHESEPICPSGDQCPYYSNSIKTIQLLEIQLAKNQKQQTEARAKYKDWEAQEIILKPRSEMNVYDEEINKLRTFFSDIVILSEVEGEMQKLEDNIQSFNKPIDEYAKQIEAFGTFSETEMNNIANGLIELNQEKDGIQDKISSAIYTLKGIEQNEMKQQEIKAQIEQLKGQRPQLLEKKRKVALIKDAFGSKGVETVVLDYLLPKLEDQINIVLAKLSDFRIRLDTQRKSADGDSVIEGLYITIINETNEEMAYENYSGGEKLKITVAISEALASMQKVGFRLFDETFLGLDENSTESFAKILAILQGKFQQILCISHLPQIKDLFDIKLLVTKAKGISQVNQC